MKADFPSEMLSAVYGLQMEARWAQPDMNGPGTDHQEPGFFFFLLYLTNARGSILWADCGPGGLGCKQAGPLGICESEQPLALGLMHVRKL